MHNPLLTHSGRKVTQAACSPSTVFFTTSHQVVRRDLSCGECGKMEMSKTESSVSNSIPYLPPMFNSLYNFKCVTSTITAVKMLVWVILSPIVIVTK